MKPIQIYSVFSMSILWENEIKSMRIRNFYWKSLCEFICIYICISCIQVWTVQKKWKGKKGDELCGYVYKFGLLFLFFVLLLLLLWKAKGKKKEFSFSVCMCVCFCVLCFQLIIELNFAWIVFHKESLYFLR